MWVSEVSLFVVGPKSKIFSVEVHHGGVFSGIGVDRAYVGGQLDWFDNVEASSWSYFWIEEFIMLLNYGFSPRNLKVYWLLPGKELSDGLRTLASDHDIEVMKAVADKVKNFVLFFDHEWHEEPKPAAEPVPRLTRTPHVTAKAAKIPPKPRWHAVSASGCLRGLFGPAVA